MNPKETPQEKREHSRQMELKNNPTGSLRDALDRGMGMGNTGDVAGGMGWKGMGLLISMLFLGYVIYRFFFN